MPHTILEKLPLVPYAQGTIRVATRGSTLALWQAHYLKKLIEKTGTAASIHIIKTTGDRVQNRFLNEIGGKGLFTKELEESLLAQETDVAIHSLKDVPTNLPEAFALAAILPRHSPSDVLIGHPQVNKLQLKSSTQMIGADDVKSFPTGLTLATGSLRRIAILKASQPTLETLPIRGNVDTRLKKLEESDWAGIILAKASINRLSITGYPMWELDPHWFVPAPGQGALALEVLGERTHLREWLKGFACLATTRAIEIERDLLQAVGGDCTLPFGAWVPQISPDTAEKSEFEVLSFISDNQGNEIRMLEKYPHSISRQGLTDDFMHKLNQQGLKKILNNLEPSNK